MIDLDREYSIPAAAQVLGMGVERLKNLVKTGQISTYRPASQLRIPGACLKNWMENTVKLQANVKPDIRTKMEARLELIRAAQIEEKI